MERISLVFMAAFLAMTASSMGDYVIAPTVGGQNTADVQPGGTVTIDLTVSSDANPSDRCTSAIFAVSFSQPGLQCDGYSWATPFATGGQDDWAVPNTADLPTTIDATTWVNPMNDPDADDICFENFVAGDDTSFSEGIMLSFDVTVLLGFPEGQVLVSVVPDTLDSGLGSIATAGQTLALNVSTAISLPGDVDGNGFVGQADLDIVLDNWGQSVPPAQERADLDGSNFIGQGDLDIVLDHWGESAQ